MNILFTGLKYILIFNLLIAISLPITSYAQSKVELDSIVKGKMANYIKSDITAQGKLNITTDVNTDFSNKNIFFNYRIQSNLQANIYGVTIPLSFSFSNGRTTYGYDLNPIQLPSFNRIGLSPKYKDLTIHLGYRQLQYTKYTLSNIQFKGVGIEYSPANYYFSIMKGALKPAVAEDFTDISLIEPSFQRDVWAVKGGYDSEGLVYGFAFLKSTDDPYSITNYETYRKSITPRENAVIGLYGKKSFGENLIFDFDYAFSGLSQDIVNDSFLDINTQYTAYNYFGLFTTRHNSIYDKALNSSLTYKFKGFDLSYNYERVDPDFRTLGAFFFNNNFITRTAGVSKSLFEEKLNINVEGGVEKIAEPSENQENVGRLIGSLNSKYKVNDRLSFTGKYSNLNNSNFIRKPSLQSSSIDSILQTQTKEKINFGSNIILGEEKNKILNLAAGYQRGIIVDGDQNLTTRNNISRNAAVSFTLAKEKTNHSLSYAVASISNNATDIFSQNLSHNFTKPINETSNFSTLTALNIITSESLNSFTLQTEVSYDFQYQDLHKITASLSSQFGQSKVNNETNNIFFLVLKFNYDIGFNYQNAKRKRD